MRDGRYDEQGFPVHDVVACGLDMAMAFFLTSIVFPLFLPRRGRCARRFTSRPFLYLIVSLGLLFALHRNGNSFLDLSS